MGRGIMVGGRSWNGGRFVVMGSRAARVVWVHMRPRGPIGARVGLVGRPGQRHAWSYTMLGRERWCN